MAALPRASGRMSPAGGLTLLPGTDRRDGPRWAYGRAGTTTEDLAVMPRFTRAGMVEVPKDRIPDAEMLPQTAYQIVLDEVMLDGNARFNLATFVTTWMDEEADRLYAATFDKNMVDKDEYPQTAEIEARCVRMLGDLWHAPHAAESVGTSTTGSSEGCMLGGLALKRRWQQARRAAGRPTDRPNIVMGGNVQVVWEKFANYWEVEPRYVPLEGDVFHLTADRLLEHVDENTIGVVAVLGSTMDGSYEPVQEICAALDEYEADQRRLRAGARRRGVRRLHRAVPPARPGLGLPAAAGGLDPGVRPQVRARLPGRRLGAVARRRVPARGPGLPRQLPGRRHAHLRAELLPARRAGRAAVLPVPAARPGGLPAGPADLPGRRRAHRPDAGRRCPSST